jgi:ABC-type antimicrobial peptide transport system permease subunit
MTIIKDFFRHVARDPLRVALTLLGIAIGSGTVVFLASTLHAAQFALSHANQEASGAAVTRVERRRPPPGTSRSVKGLSNVDVRAMAEHEKLPPGSSVGASSLYSRQGTVGGRTKKVGVQSGGQPYGDLAGFRLAHGRWPRPDEDGQRVCVLGAALFEEFFDGQWPLPSDGIVLDGAVRLTVVGVLEPKPPIGGGDGDGTWQVDRRIFVSHPTFVRSVAFTDEFDEIAMRLGSEESGDMLPSPKDIASALSPLLEALHFGVKNFEFDALSRGADLDVIIHLALTVILIGCGLVCTVVGGVNVMNAQWVAVAERTREYGIRRALGVSGQRLQAGVLAETILLTVTGSVLGVAVGVLLALGFSLVLTKVMTPWPFAVEPWSIGLAFGGAGLTGIVAGWLPAKRASKLDVATCLRGE